MVGMDTLKLVLALGASLDFDMVKLDTREAYLSTSVDDVDAYYARRPPGVRSSELPYTMKPACFTYGHPLASKKFRALLVKILSKVGARPSNYDVSLYTLDSALGRALVPTTVDDMPTMYSGGASMLNFLKVGLSEVLEVTCDDPLLTVLGMELTRDRSAKTTTLRQRGAQYSLLDRVTPTWRTDDTESFARVPKSPSGPLSAVSKSLSLTSLSKEEHKELRAGVGELSWISSTAPDFTFSTRASARRVHCPHKYDMKELNQVVSCMAGVVRKVKDGLTLGGKETELLLTTDTSYHGLEDLKSCTGGTVHLNHRTGSNSSTCEKHTLTADSAMAAEGIGAHIHMKKVLPTTYLLEELGLDTKAPAKFYMDSVPFMQTILGDKGPSSRSKHMLIRLQVTKEALEAGKIDLLHLRSEHMVADILTKALH